MRTLRLTLMWIGVYIALFGFGVGMGALVGGDFEPSPQTQPER